VSSNGTGEGGAFVENQLCGTREAVVCAIFPFPYLDISNSAAVRMSDESRFEEPNEVGFVRGES
jgi:hypothetical protein